MEVEVVVQAVVAVVAAGAAARHLHHRDVREAEHHQREQRREAAVEDGRADRAESVGDVVGGRRVRLLRVGEERLGDVRGEVDGVADGEDHHHVREHVHLKREVEEVRWRCSGSRRRWWWQWRPVSP